jgi:hypothetical protein
MSDGMELDANKLQVFNAALHLALIVFMVTMRTKTGQSKKSARIFRAHLRDLIMTLHVVLGARIRLHDGGVYAAFILSPKHFFHRAVESENAALTQMSMCINYFAQFIFLDWWLVDA